MTIKVKFEDNNEEFSYISFEELLKLDNYNDITFLHCGYNNLTSLPTLPSSLTELYYSVKPIRRHIDEYFKSN